MADLPAYNKLYAWMHRISNAKLNDLEEGTEWWLYDSCDGPTCGPDRGTTVATTTAAAGNTTSTAAPDVSNACLEAQKALSAEENSLTNKKIFYSIKKLNKQILVSENCIFILRF